MRAAVVNVGASLWGGLMIPTGLWCSMQRCNWWKNKYLTQQRHLNSEDTIPERKMPDIYLLPFCPNRLVQTHCVVWQGCDVCSHLLTSMAWRQSRWSCGRFQNCGHSRKLWERWESWRGWTSEWQWVTPLGSLRRWCLCSVFVCNVRSSLLGLSCHGSVSAHVCITICVGS